MKILRFSSLSRFFWEKSILWVLVKKGFIESYSKKRKGSILWVLPKFNSWSHITKKVQFFESYSKRVPFFESSKKSSNHWDILTKRIQFFESYFKKCDNSLTHISKNGFNSLSHMFKKKRFDPLSALWPTNFRLWITPEIGLDFSQERSCRALDTTSRR